MRNLNSNKIKIFVFIALLLVGIGYAAINTALTITGNSSISGDSSNFKSNIYFANGSLTSTHLTGTDLVNAQPRIEGNYMEFDIPPSASLKAAGDKIEVTYTIRNESNYRALVGIPTVKSNNSDYLDYFTVTHSRNEEIELGVNETSGTQKLTLTLKKSYPYDATINFMFKVEINATAIESNTNGLNNGNGNITKRFARETPSATSTTNFMNIVNSGEITMLQKEGGTLSACIYENNELFCIPNKWEDAKNILSQKFTEDECDFGTNYSTYLNCSRGNNDYYADSENIVYIRTGNSYKGCKASNFDGKCDDGIFTCNSNPC